ncbi:hypothetical protein ASF37_15245 [Aeromicrobium sp. Leaf289]|uniref:O-antigen ligase family protein n=1 Tax=Aeromicrobium sp. Leaf289 TaxID=1736324 RepID=UPI00070172DA|nr:O-antigen ligase family protein [Aeromicrobium sp. Leaf289]KQP75595.1 hypothetical protein ASF37_15245 [Aeromicrobium sp. Leaf289]
MAVLESVKERVGPRERRAIRAAVLPVLVVGVLLVVLVPLSSLGGVGAGLALTFAVGLVVLAAVGVESTAVAVLAIGIALSPLDNFRPIGALAFASLSDLVLLAGLLVLLPVLLRKPLPSEWLFLAAAGGLVVVGLVSSAGAEESGASLNSLLRLLVGALLLPVAFMVWRPSRGVVVGFALMYVVGNVGNLVAAYTVGESSWDGRRIGYSTHPNVMGLCAMLGLALVPFLLRVLPRRWSWLVLLLGAACAWNVWVSGSRAALVVAVAVAVLFVALERRVEVALALFGLAIPALWIVGNALTGGGSMQNNVLGRLLGGGTAAGSDAEREYLAKVALDAFTSHPVLGIGLGDVMEAHNIYLQVAAAVGIVGTAVYLVLLASVALRAITLPGPSALLALPVLGYAMIGLMTTILWDRYVWAVLALPFLVRLGDGAPEADPADTVPSTDQWETA